MSNAYRKMRDLKREAINSQIGSQQVVSADKMLISILNFDSLKQRYGKEQGIRISLNYVKIIK